MKLKGVIVALLLSIAIYGQGWSALGPGVDGPVNAFAGDSSLAELYVGGNFNNSGLMPYEKFGLWGGAWDPSVNSGPNGPIYAMTVYNGSIFIGGDFDSVGNMPAKNIAEWAGTFWRAVGGGVNKAVYALKSFGNYLFVGGNFDTVSPAPIPIAHIATWDGLNWNRVAIAPDPNGPVKSIEFFNGELYIGGSFSSVGGITANNIAKLNGAWASLGTGMNNQVLALQVYNGELYAGGKFTLAGGNPANYVAKWNGSSFIQVSNGTSGDVSCFTIYNNLLVAGGSFTYAGGTVANNIAAWNGTGWSDLGGGTDNDVNGLTSFYGDLYVGGMFANAGGISCMHVAKWDSPVGIHDLSKQRNDDLAVPNPFSISTSIHLSNWTDERCFLQMYNTLGEKVKVISRYEQEIIILDRGNLTTGIYYYKIISNTGEIKSGKLVIQD